MADLIDRQDLLDAFDIIDWYSEKLGILIHGSRSELVSYIKWHEAIKTIEEAPTVEPLRGEWVEPTVEWVDDVKFVLAKCSACGNRAVMDMEQLNDTIKFARNFCGNCGADMRPKEDKDDHD